MVINYLFVFQLKESISFIITIFFLEIKDYEGYLKALSEQPIASWKHEMIVHKLEHDLLRHLSITQQQEKNIVRQENAFTKYSEIEILKGDIK